MVLRLIEMILPEENKEDLEKMLKGEVLPVLDVWMVPVQGIWERPVRGVWKRSFSENRILVRMLLLSEVAETVTDRLEKRFSRMEGFRMVLLPVQASIPRLDLPEEKKANAKEPTSEVKRKAARKRVSREELYTDLAYTTQLSQVYFVMIVLSSIVAAIGVLRDNVAVIIGAMVIAPLLGPNVSFSLATILGDLRLARSALRANLVGIFTAVALSTFLGYMLTVDPSTPEIASRTVVGLGDLALALAAGSAGALAFTTGISATLIGVMVAVALLPPLVTFGLLMGSGNESLATGAMLLFIANFICVNLASVATFLAQGIRPARWREVRKARRVTYISLLIWLLMLAVLVVIILFLQGV